MVKRALTLLTSILIALPLLMPFNIFADETVNTAPFLGVNVQFTEVETEYTSMTMPILNFGYAGTQNTNGTVTGKMACSAFSSGECATWSLQNSNGNSVAGLSFTMNLANLKLTENGVWQFNKAYNYIVDYEFVLDGDYKGYVVLNGDTTIYVNGRSFHHSVKQSGISELTFTITDYELTLITNPIMWNIPIESLGYNYFLFERYKYEGFTDIDLYSYPMFTIKQNDSVFNYYSVQGKTLTIIFGINETVSGYTQFNNNFSYTGHSFLNGTTLYSYQLLDGSYFCIYKVNLLADGNGPKEIKYIGSKTIKYIGIYARRNDTDIPSISTDFALRYGLSNKLLDDLNLIANGTVQSNNAASSNDLANEQLQTDSNTLFSHEDNFKSDMQSAMQNVNTTFRLQDMGTKFVNSAQWVRTQYENLTNNTPFASLITFSLISGLALILLGKVYK